MYSNVSTRRGKFLNQDSWCISTEQYLHKSYKIHPPPQIHSTAGYILAPLYVFYSFHFLEIVSTSRKKAQVFCHTLSRGECTTTIENWNHLKSDMHTKEYFCVLFDECRITFFVPLPLCWVLIVMSPVTYQIFGFLGFWMLHSTRVFLFFSMAEFTCP